MRRLLLGLSLAFAVSCASNQPPTAESPSSKDEVPSPDEGAPANATVQAPPAISPDEALVAIRPLVTTMLPTAFRVVAISEEVDDWVAVAIDPPYREFPNVFLFRREGEKWKRVREALGLGVQPYPSPYLDLHSLGMAQDMMVTPPGTLMTDKAIGFVDAGVEREMASSVYAVFAHQHPMGKEDYFLDRRALAHVAPELYPQYAEYKHPSCLRYDYPPLRGISLTKQEGKIQVAVKTRSGQGWVVRFAGVDERGLLTERELSVGWLAERHETPPVERSETPLECSAPPPDELRAGLTIRMAQAQACGRLAADAETTAKAGRVELRVQVDSAGRVVHAQITKDEFGDPQAASCVLASFLRPYLASPTADCTSVEFGFEVSTGGNEDGAAGADAK